MVGVDQVDLHLVRAGWHAGDVDRVVVTGVRPPPRQVVDADVQMPDPWRYAEGALPEHRYDAYVLRPVLDPDEALGQRLGMRWVDDQYGGRLVLDGGVRCGTADLPRALS